MSNLDFTLAKYKDLCESILESNYTTLTFSRYLSSKNLPDKVVILRHDVDRKPEHALKMAQLEEVCGITSTYYFRMVPSVFNPDIIRTIRDYGHEVGYHYEVLDKAKGDFGSAIRLFEYELSEFRKICAIQTICMHGNPLSRWNNRDLWKKYDFKNFGIIGEPYLSIDYSKVYYLTDTGRSWNSNFSIKDVVFTVNKSPGKIKNTGDVIGLIKAGTVNHYSILIHPERWNDSLSAWLVAFLWQNIKNIGKLVIKHRVNSA